MQDPFMLQTSAGEGAPDGTGHRRIMPVLLWLALSTGWLVSIFSVIEELCLATACSDTASFTIFGMGMGWFGIAFFTLILPVLWLRQKVRLMEWVLDAMVFAGIGAELRLLWIQKYIIGSWCPLCITISCALLAAAMLLVIEKVQKRGAGRCGGKNLAGWLAFIMAMSATGLLIAIAGVYALT